MKSGFAKLATPHFGAYANRSSSLTGTTVGLCGVDGRLAGVTAFRTAWQNQHVYNALQNPKIVYILSRLSDTYLGSKSEHITINIPLTIEHILPQGWLEHWPLPDGARGLTEQELWDVDADNSRAQATRRRNDLLQTLGNLTILTQALNSAVSNSAWTGKKAALLSASLLPINQQLHDVETWDETAIERRSKNLFDRSINIWPGAQ